MEYLVCWLLMGVRKEPIEVWYELGNFDTQREAKDAACGADWEAQGFKDVSVVAYYRVEPDFQPSVSRVLRRDDKRGRTKTPAKVV